MPDIKARAGDREGSGAHEGSPRHRGFGCERAREHRALRTRVRREMAALEAVGPEGRGWRSPRRAVEPAHIPRPPVGL